MTDLPTLGLLSLTDGRLMSDISDVYEVISLFIGRPAYTHELPLYGRRAVPLILSHFPGLVAQPDTPWQQMRDDTLQHLGYRTVIPPEWIGRLADGRGPISTLSDAVEQARSAE